MLAARIAGARIVVSMEKNQRLLHATIEQIFQTSFQRNVRPDWLISPDGNKMELDGYSEQLQIAFEYNGEQHYNKKHMFYRESHDALKKADLRKSRNCSNRS